MVNTDFSQKCMVWQDRIRELDADGGDNARGSSPSSGGGMFYTEVTRVGRDGTSITTPVKRSSRLAKPATPASVRKALEDLLIGVDS